MARREDLSTLGGRMKAAARRAGKNAVQIAAEMGVDVVSVRRWGAAGTGTKNARTPTAENLATYARVTNTTVEELLGDTAVGDRLLLDRLTMIAERLMAGLDVSAAFGEVTEADLISPEHQVRLDVASQLFRLALAQLLHPKDWDTATLEERQGAVRRLTEKAERDLARRNEGRVGGSAARIQ